MKEPTQNNRCGFCNSFIPDEEDIQLIPVGSCANKSTSSDLVDFHHTECKSFSLKPGLIRTINCNGCNFELWPEFSCECVRNYTSEIDCYYKAG